MLKFVLCKYIVVMGYLYCIYQFNIVYIFMEFNRQGTAQTGTPRLHLHILYVLNKVEPITSKNSK